MISALFSFSRQKPIRAGFFSMALIASVIGSATAAPLETAPPIPVAPAAASTPLSVAPSQLPKLFNIVRASFWRAENALMARAFNSNLDLDRSARLAFFAAPLEKDDPLRKEYSRAALAADRFIAACDAARLAPGGLPAMLYLGAVARYTLGEYSRSLELIERIRRDYPDYKRDQFLNDRDAPDLKYSVPVAASLDKLRLYGRLQTLPPAPPDALAALQEMTAAAQTAFASQREYSRWVESLSDSHNLRAFEEGRFGGEPDGLRASALPSTLSLLEGAWETLAPQSEAGGLRAFLRAQVAAGGAIETLARRFLENSDALLITQFFGEAQTFSEAKNFDGARSKFRQIIAEWPDSQSSLRAEEELSRLAPLAVEYYQAEGEKNFAPLAPGQFMKGQDKAAEYFAAMLAEINGDSALADQADKALLGLARAQSTQGKLDEAVANLQTLLQTFPGSENASEAQYYLGFIWGSPAPIR